MKLKLETRKHQKMKFIFIIFQWKIKQVLIDVSLYYKNPWLYCHEKFVLN
jgi:hypothetical protein